jgi:hypothetical protein
MSVFPQPVRSFRAVSANTTALPGEVLSVTTGASAITVTLPPVAEGGPVTVKKIDSGTGAITVVTADGATVDGVVGTTGRTQAATEYLSWTLESDYKSAWIQVS